MSEPTTPTGGGIRVGDFVVDPRSGELRGGGGKLVLSAQPLQVLLALSERPGELVTRDELRARLWPADTYVDFEHGLNAIVKRLRDAVGDSADAPRYIETVPRRGYRLVAPVEIVATNPPDRALAAVVEEAPPEPRPAPSSRKTRPILAAVAVGVVVTAAIVSVVRWRSAEAATGAQSSPANVHPTRLTFGPGLQTDAAWSPDGRRIAYAADLDGNFDLLVQSLSGGEPVRVTRTTANETQPAWSPDGRRLVFRSDEDGGGLFTVSIDGGSTRRIADVGFQPAWMPDGREILFVITGVSLYLVKADGGEPPRQILKEALAGGRWTSFAVHPDGRIGVFGSHPESRLGFYVSDREYRQLRSVTDATRLPSEVRLAPGRVVWSTADDAIFMESLAAGVPAIWRAEVDPATQAWGPPVRLATGPGGAERAAVSPDGKTLAFTNAQSTVRAWVFPFDADRGTPPGEGRAVTDEDASIRNVHLSADGSTIYYREVRSGREDPRGVRTDIETGETTVLVTGAYSGLVPSPNGQGESYALLRLPSRAAPSQFEFALAWRDAKGSERLLAPWTRSELLPSDIRPDGRAVLATRVSRPDCCGPTSLVEWPIGSTPATAPERVVVEAPNKQFWQGRYSPDGRWVAFVVLALDPEGSLEMGIAPADSRGASTWSRVAADHWWPDKPRWSPDGRSIYFLSRAPSGYLNLWGVRIDQERGRPTGAPFPIARFDSPRWHVDPNLGVCEMGVARDRLVLPMRTIKGSIWLLQNVGT